MPEIPLNPKAASNDIPESLPSPPITGGTKRTASDMDDGIELVEPSAKRQKVEGEASSAKDAGNGKNGDAEMIDVSDDEIEIL